MKRFSLISVFGVLVVFASVAGAMQEYEDLKVLVAEIEHYVSKADSGTSTGHDVSVVADGGFCCLLDCYVDCNGNLWLCWWNRIDWSVHWEYAGYCDGDNIYSAFDVAAIDRARANRRSTVKAQYL